MDCTSYDLCTSSPSFGLVWLSVNGRSESKATNDEYVDSRWWWPCFPLVRKYSSSTGRARNTSGRFVALRARRGGGGATHARQ